MTTTGGSNLEFRVSVGGLNQLGRLESQIVRVTNGTVGMKNASLSLGGTFSKLEGAAKDVQKIYFGQAKTLKQLTRNQKIFRNTVRSTVGELKVLRKETTRGSAGWIAFSKGIRQARKDLRRLPLRKLGTDLKSVSNNLLNIGKNTQWTGRQMMVGITAPLGMVMRSAMRAFESFEQQFVRTTKILGLTGKAMSQVGGAAYELRQSIRGVSERLGASQTIVAALTSDFAQMGKALLGGKGPTQDIAVEYAELALQLEKVGQVQAGVGRDFISNLAGLIKHLDAGGSRIDKVRGLLAKFNMVENTTALSMADLAEAFPQVSPAAVAAGVSLTFLTGVIGRMKEMGLNATESAHALKFALQRMINPTKKVVDLAERLGNAIGPEFHKDLGIGNEMLFNLAENIRLIKEEASDETALVYLGELVGKRQASRIFAAVGGMKSLKDSIGDLSEAFGEFGGGRATLDLAAELGIAESLTDVKTAISKAFASEDTIAEFKKAVVASSAGFAEGLDETSTSSAIMAVALQKLSPELKALAIDYMGATAAGEVFQAELATVIEGPAAQMDILRTTFRNLLQEVGSVFYETIQGMLPHVKKFIKFLTEMGDGTKKFLIIFLSLIAVIGPAAFVFGQMANTFALFGKGAAGLLPKMKTLTRSLFLAKTLAGESTPRMRIFGTGLVQVGKKAKISGIAVQKWASKTTKAMMAVRAVAADPGVSQSLLASGLPQAASVKTLGGRGKKAAAKAAMHAAPRGPTLPTQPIRGTKLARFGKIGKSIARSSEQVDNFSAKMKQAARTMAFAGRQNRIAFDMAPASKMGRAALGMQQTQLAQIKLNWKKRFVYAKSFFTKKKVLAIKDAAFTKATALKTAVFQRMSALKTAIFSKSVFGNAMRGIGRVMKIGFKSIFHVAKIQALLSAAVFKIAFKSAIKAIKASMMTTGILALFLIVAGVVVFIKNNLGDFGKAMAPGLKVLKTAFGAFVGTLKTIGAIVFDVFGQIFGGGGEGGGAASGISKVGDMFTKVAGVIQKFADILDKVIKKYLPIVLKVAMGAFKKFVEVVAGGIGWMIQNWRMIAETVVNFLHIYMQVQEFFLDALLTMVRIASRILRKLVAVFFAVAQPIAIAIGKVLEVLGFLYKGVTKVVQFIVEKFFWLLEALTPIINGIGGLIGGLVNLLPGEDVDWSNWMPSAEALEEMKNTISDGAGAVGDVISKAITWIGKELPGAIKRTSGVLDAVLSGVDDVLGTIIDANLADTVNDFLTGILDRDFDFGGGIASGIEDGVADAEIGVDDIEETGLTEAVAEATGKGFKSAVNDFVGKVKAALKEELAAIIDSALAAFDAYAEVQLSAYDARIDAINAVKKAEAELTKTLKYESDRRALINKMALDKENFIRNRSLAIYEGRVEDARNLAVKFNITKESSSDKLNEMDDKRQNYLVNKERDAAIELIKIAKAAEKERLAIIRNGLEEQLRLAQEKLPATFEEFQAWMDSVSELVDVGFQEAFGDSGVLESSLEGVGQTLKDAINGWDSILEDFDPVVKFQAIFDKVNEEWIAALQWELIALSWMDQYMDAAIPVLIAALAAARGEVEGAVGAGIDKIKDDKKDEQAHKGLLGWMEDVKNTADAVMLTFVEKWQHTNLLTKEAKARAAQMDETADQNLIANYGPPRFFGGAVKAQYGRYLNGFKSAAVPILAHGGEYVMSAKAVQNVGLSNLEAMNNSRHYDGGGGASGVNIYVDNFVGQPEWFEGMMSDYNVSVAPKNERSRGVESRKISSMSDNNRRGRV